MSYDDAAISWDALRPARAAMLLSLDVARPFIPDLGLAIRGDFEWADCMREFVRQHRGSVARADVSPAPPRVSDLVIHTRSKLNPTASHVLEWWLKNIYSEATIDHAAYRAWDNVFRHARRDPSAWVRLALPAEAAGPVLDRLTAATSTRSFTARWEQATATPLSDWDLHMYAINGWNDDLPDAPNGPESQLYLVTRDYRHRSFWDSLVTQLSTQEQQQLQRSAQTMVDATPELAYLGVLPPLTALRVEWP